MSKNDAVRQKLEQKRDRLQRKIAEVQGAEAVETSEGETDNAHEWENADVRADLVREATAELEAVQAALARIDAGEFGVCSSCGKPIATGRLEALPEAVMCATCAGRLG